MKHKKTKLLLKSLTVQLSHWTPKSTFLSAGIWKSPPTDQLLKFSFSRNCVECGQCVRASSQSTLHQSAVSNGSSHFCLSLRLKLKTDYFMHRHTSVKHPCTHLQCDVYAVCLHSNCRQAFTAHFSVTKWICVVPTLTMQRRFLLRFTEWFFFFFTLVFIGDSNIYTHIKYE